MKYTIDTNTNITDIINKLKDNDELFFKRGKYHLKLSLKQNNLKISGEGMFNTIIYNDDHYHKIMSDYNECNTFRTYTLEILGDNCTIEDICITNTCDSKTYGQAVTLNVYGNNFLANNIMLKSEQDTLFTGPLPADLILRYKERLGDYEINDLFNLFEEYLFKRYKETSAKRYLYTFNYSIKGYFINRKVSDITSTYCEFINDSINILKIKSKRNLIFITKTFILCV